MPKKIEDREAMRVFGERLQSVLTKQGLSRIQMAALMNMDRSMVDQYVRGDAYPGMEKLVRICEALECSADYLLGLATLAESATPAQAGAKGAESRFGKTYCSECGGEFGPGNEGYSHCSAHAATHDRRQNFIDGLDLYISQLEAVPGNSTLTMMLRGLMKAHGVGSSV